MELFEEIKKFVEGKRKEAEGCAKKDPNIYPSIEFNRKHYEGEVAACEMIISYMDYLDRAKMWNENHR